MRVRRGHPDDCESWLELAGEVERLFGPMRGDAGFRAALAGLLEGGGALVVRQGDGGPGARLLGAVAFDRGERDILWLAVAEAARGAGVGRSLVEVALAELGPGPVTVQTFAPGSPAGAAARKLYRRLGFADHAPAAPNPAGLPTVVMRRPG